MLNFLSEGDFPCFSVFNQCNTRQAFGVKPYALALALAFALA